MKFFPIKVVMLCLLVPPFLYVFTLTSCEKYLNQQYSDQIQNILIGESKNLLDGSIRLEEQIADNIHDFLKTDWMVSRAKLDINIMVTTAQGKVVYPVSLDPTFLAKDINSELDPITTAKNNFESLHSGLIVKIETRLSHGSMISNMVLFVYFGVSFFIFLVFYRISSSKAAEEREMEAQLINQLKKEDQHQKEIVKNLTKERQGLFENIKSLNTKYQEDTTKAKINEEEMFKEIISLEGKINAFIELKQSTEAELSELKAKIQKGGRRKGSKARRNEFDFISKRFSALYKNIVMNRKAVTGFLSLGEDQQIKAEEIVHILDQDPDKLTIKRKVFSGKKNKTASFEVLFAYNGRLYFRKLENNITEVLVIGTKNTQTKDMEFLHSL